MIFEVEQGADGNESVPVDIAFLGSNHLPERVSSRIRGRIRLM
jgi:hypothetical protein